MDISAQSEDTGFSGNVEDGKGRLQENVTLLLLNALDSSYVAGTITNSSGQYYFQKIRRGSYFLEVSMLGFYKRVIPVETEGLINMTIPTIILEEDSHQLASVVVIAERKQVELEVGRTVVNLSSSLVASRGTAFDALKNIPGVLVREDGSIFLYGKTGVNVLVDNKLTYLSGESLVNLLRSIPSSSVDKIELTTHPSSQYDASGNSGLINIQTKKVRVQGVNLSVFSNFQQGKESKGYEGVNYSFKRNRWNFYADYSFNWGKDYTNVISDRYYPLDNNPSNNELTLSMTAFRKFRYKSHFLRGGGGYELSDKITIDAYITGNWYDWRKREINYSGFFTLPGAEDSLQTTNSRMRIGHTNITGGINIIYAFMEKGKWDLSYDFQRFDRNNEQMQSSCFKTPSTTLDKDDLNGCMNGNIDINTSRTNVTYPVSEKVIMDAGAKASFVSIGSVALYQNFHASEWVNNDLLSNSFFYDENINAAYVKFMASLSSSLFIDAGLRLENTNVESRQAYLAGGKDSLFSYHYTNLFPNLVFQYNISGNQSLSLMYGRRIARPNYRDLNPFIEVNDAYLYDQGNTELKPEFSDNLELSYFLRKQYGISLQYSRRTDPIAKSYVLKENRLVIVTPKNLRTNYSYGVRLSLNNLKPLPWWIMNINSSLMYKKFNWLFDFAEGENVGFTLMVHVSNQFNLPYGWTGEIVGYYNGRMAEGQALIHPLGLVSAGIKRNILKNKASIQLFADDILNTNRVHMDLMGATNGWYKEETDNRRVGIAFTWRFNSGNTIKESSQNNRIEESKRINL